MYLSPVDLSSRTLHPSTEEWAHLKSERPPNMSNHAKTVKTMFGGGPVSSSFGVHWDGLYLSLIGADLVTSRSLTPGICSIFTGSISNQGRIFDRTQTVNLIRSVKTQTPCLVRSRHGFDGLSLSLHQIT